MLVCPRAPEQFHTDGRNTVSQKTDVWAFGCMLLAMVTGEEPWPKLGLMQIRNLVRTTGSSTALMS
jgi:serine/threonine protein kinase